VLSVNKSVRVETRPGGHYHCMRVTQSGTGRREGQDKRSSVHRIELDGFTIVQISMLSSI
jgi:hypothetical protein